MLHKRFPNEHRFLLEEVYPDLAPYNPTFDLAHGMFQQKDICIEYVKDGRKVREFTPLHEVEGWCLPGRIREQGGYRYMGSENYLKQYYAEQDGH